MAKTTHLYAPGCHFELSSQLLPQRAVWLRLLLERVLEDFELRTGCSFAMFDDLRVVWVECAEIDRRGVYAWRKGDVGCLSVRVRVHE